MVAILPAGGRGTRMAAVTGGRAKELLPLGGRAVIEWVVDEAYEAGAKTLHLIGSPDKPELDAWVFAHDLPSVEIHYQPNPLGLADAVLRAPGDEPALLLLPDTVYPRAATCIALREALAPGVDLAVAVRPVRPDEVSSYGIVEFDPETGRIARMLEKPQPEETSSRWAVSARYALSPALRQLARELGGTGFPKDASITLVFEVALELGWDLRAVPIASGTALFDCGSPEGYREACAALDAHRTG